MSAQDITLYRSDPNVEPATDEDEINTVRMCLEAWNGARTARERWDRLWQENWNFYVGRHYKPRARWKSAPKENYILSKTRVMLATLTDNRPRISVLPTEQEFAEYSDQMQHAVDRLWGRLKMRRCLIDVTLNALIFGKGIFYTYWDPDKEEICTESVDPQCVWADDRATSARDARFWFHKAEMTPGEILERWPEADGLFVPGTRTIESQDFKTGIVGDDRVPYHMAGRAYDYGQGGPAQIVPYSRTELYEQTDQEKLVEVLQCWIRDYSWIRDPYMENGRHKKDKYGRFLYEERQKYPNGRLVILAGGRVLHDKAAPYEHGRFPYSELDINRLPGELWGLGAVQNLVPIQKELNKTLGQIIDNKNLMGNMQWLVDDKSGISAKMIRGIPGLVIRKRFGSEATRLESKPLPNYITQFLDHCMLALDRVSGVSDVTEGRKPTGITAGVAIESLQEAAQAVMRLDVANLEDALVEVGEQWIGLMNQFYEGGRSIRVTDPDTGKFYFQTLNEEAIRAQWEIEVAAGSTLPRSREARFQQAVAAMQVGLFDQVAALRWMDHPDRDREIKRLQGIRDQKVALAANGVDLRLVDGGQG